MPETRLAEVLHVLLVAFPVFGRIDGALRTTRWASARRARGATVMAGLSTDLALATSDTLTLAVEDTVISTVTYSGAPHGTSIGLDPDYVGSPDDMAGWCPQMSTYGAGDHGTPGDPNDGC